VRLLLLTLIATSSLTYADEFEDDLSGFEEDSITIVKIEQIKDRTHQLKGSLNLSSSYNYAHNAPTLGNTDFRGLSRLKTTLDLSLDSKLNDKWKSKIEIQAFYDAIYSTKNNFYTNDMVKTYESEFEIQEAYILGSISDNIDLKIGRQIVVWGKSDNIRINDVINPLDNRELAMVDIEDLRLPVFMSKLDYYSGAWNLSAMIIHESRVQKEAANGSDYLPTHIFLKPNAIFPEDITPDSTLNNTQYALSLNGRFTGWDLSFYGAKVLDSKWHFVDNKKSRTYDFVKTLGVASNIAIGNFLFTSELLYMQDLKFNTTADEKSRLDFLLGTEYSGITDLTLSLEVSQRYIFDYEVSMVNAPDSTYKDERQTALRVSYSFEHEKGMLTYLNTLFYDNSNINGGFQRVWLNYDLNDNFEVNIGVVDYIGGDKIVLDAISNNDRFFADISYNF